MTRAQSKTAPAIVAAALALLVAAPANSATYTGPAAPSAPTTSSNAQPLRSVLPAPVADGSFQVADRGSRRAHRGGRHFGNKFNRRGRHFNRRHHRRHRNAGVGIAAGVAAAIIGGAIVNSQRAHAGRWERCDARYRTFRWSDGTYIPYAGAPRELCPYLRR